ncbi:MAG: hypothetical protein KF729_00895 [Sandaracinaceae bacterium]|nr:hypothetical protein [Sandaracinaceae bacterium]
MRRVLGAVLGCALGCAGPPPHPPTAVIDVSPATLCAGDDYRTVLSISGARSSADLSLLPAPPEPGAAPLAFAWALEGAAHVVVAGSRSAPQLSVTSAGDRPLHVVLTVRDDEGGEATSLRTVALVECAP